MKSFLGKKHRLAALAIYVLVVLPQVVAVLMMFLFPSLFSGSSLFSGQILFTIAAMGTVTSMAVGILTEIVNGLWDKETKT